MKENEISLIERKINIPNIYKCQFHFDYFDYNKLSKSLVGIGFPLNECSKDYIFYKGSTKIVISGIEEDDISLYFGFNFNVIILTSDDIKKLYSQPDGTAQYFLFIKDINKFKTDFKNRYYLNNKDFSIIEKKYNNKIKILSEKIKRISKKIQPLFDIKNKIQTLEKEYIFEIDHKNKYNDNLYLIRNKKVLNERRIYQLDLEITRIKRLINKFKPN